MPFCGNCGKQVPGGQKFCGNCGRDMAEVNPSGLSFDNPEIASSPTQGLIGCLFAAIGLPLALWIWFSSSGSPSTSRAPTPPRAANSVRYFVTKQLAYCSPSEEEARLVARALRRNDSAALEGMLRRQRVFVLAEQTRVRWLFERPPAVAKIRIESGSNAGIECYAPDGYLRPE